MAVRIRKDRKIIVCAAKSKEEPGDTYLDDGVHYTLSVELEILHHIGIDENDADLWEFWIPSEGEQIEFKDTDGEDHAGYCYRDLSNKWLVRCPLTDESISLLTIRFLKRNTACL